MQLPDNILGGSDLWVRGVQRVCPAEVPDPDGTAPLHVAALSGQVDLLRLFLDAGADVNKRCYLEAASECSSGGSGGGLSGPFEGQTALHLACACPRGPNIAAVALLLRAGAAVDARDGRGDSPLLLALAAPLKVTLPAQGQTLSPPPSPGAGKQGGKQGDKRANRMRDGSDSARSLEAVAALLIGHGADPTAKDWMGRSGVQLAHERAVQLPAHHPPPQPKRTPAGLRPAAAELESGVGPGPLPPQKAKQSPTAMRAWTDRSLAQQPSPRGERDRSDRSSPRSERPLL